MPTTAKTLLVIGGTSDIGRATALVYARDGWTIQLAGRDIQALRREVDDIAARTGATVTAHEIDILQTGSFETFVDGLPTLPDTAVCVVGLMGDQSQAESDLNYATTIMRSNFEGPALILGLLADRFLARKAGVIVGVSSVAGERGRASNYVYGSAKAGFTAFLSGLRNRCAKQGVHVITVKPGFVRTKMTEGLKLPPLLTAQPAEVAARILTAERRRETTIYVRPIWRIIMTVISLIPESVFMKMKI